MTTLVEANRLFTTQLTLTKKQTVVFVDRRQTEITPVGCRYHLLDPRGFRAITPDILVILEDIDDAGWGASPEALERYLTWVAKHGLTHFVTHLCQYRLTTHAIQDWPPSHPVHLNWREEFPVVLERVKRRDGDRQIVSPARFTGQKNSTDRPDAPKQTRGVLWHFKPLCLPTGIALHKGRG